MYCFDHNSLLALVTNKARHNGHSVMGNRPLPPNAIFADTRVEAWAGLAPIAGTFDLPPGQPWIFLNLRGEVNVTLTRWQRRQFAKCARFAKSLYATRGEKL
jgi:hypothetical protein